LSISILNNRIIENTSLTAESLKECHVVSASKKTPPLNINFE